MARTTLWTANKLAQILGVPSRDVINELTSHGERGVLTRDIEKNTLITPGAANRTLERRGISHESVEIKEMEESDWELLKPAAAEAPNFHRTYGKTVGEFTEKTDPEAAKELVEYHQTRANAIDNEMKKLEKLKTPETPGL